MARLHANIGVGHENDVSIIDSRIVAAAQCNVDAIVMNKSTPVLTIPEEKKYVAIPSKWGTMPYIDVARRSELTSKNATHIAELCEKIGVELIWSVTDIEALEFVLEYCKAQHIKLHSSCSEEDYQTIVPRTKNVCKTLYARLNHLNIVKSYWNPVKHNLKLYHTTDNWDPDLIDINLEKIDKTRGLYRDYKIDVGYECKQIGIFPTLAYGYKCDFIEKYLGDKENEERTILTPPELYELWNSLSLMEQAL
jgi:sialic acid synthase SpsE